jgi:hypothetical protein
MGVLVAPITLVPTMTMCYTGHNKPTLGGTMAGRKATTQERQAMQRTQPKMARVIEGGRGKGKMVVVEESEVVKERKAAEAAARAAKQADE